MLLAGLEKAGGIGGDLKSSGHDERTISTYARTLEAATQAGMSERQKVTADYRPGPGRVLSVRARRGPK